MKKRNLTVPVLLLISFGLLAALMTALFRPIYVPSIHPYAKIKEVNLYTETFDPENFIGGLDISPIAEILANSEWKSTKPEARPRILFAIQGMRGLRLSYYGSFFTMEGVEGHFIVPFKNRDKVAAFLQRVRTDLIRPAQNTAQTQQ